MNSSPVSGLSRLPLHFVDWFEVPSSGYDLVIHLQFGFVLILVALNDILPVRVRVMLPS